MICKEGLLKHSLLYTSVQSSNIDAPVSQILSRYSRWYRKGSHPTASTVATTPPISPIISLLPPHPWLTTGYRADDIDGPFRRTPALAISHKPTPAPSSASKPTATAVKSRHETVICAELTPPCAPPTFLVEFHHTLPSPSSSLAPATEAELLKPDAAGVVLVPGSPSASSVWACSNGLGTDSGKDGECVAGSLANPQAGHGVISRGDEVAERVEHQRAYI